MKKSTLALASIAFIGVTAPGSAAIAAKAPQTCRAIFGPERMLELPRMQDRRIEAETKPEPTRAEALEKALLDQATAEPQSIYYRATEIIDSFFARSLKETRSLVDFLVREGATNSVSPEINEIAASEARIKTAHVKLDNLISPSPLRRLLTGWRKKNLEKEVNELAEEIQNCHVQASACGLKINSKVANLEQHLVGVLTLQKKLAQDRQDLEIALVGMGTKLDSQATKDDIAMAAAQKITTVTLEQANLENHVRLIKNEFVRAGLAQGSLNSIDVLLNSAIQLGRPYAMEARRAQAEVERRAREETLTLEDKRTIEDYVAKRPWYPGHRLAMLGKISHFEATNAVIKYIGSTPLKLELRAKYRAALSNKRYHPQNMDAVLKITDNHPELLLEMKEDGFFGPDKHATEALLRATFRLRTEVNLWGIPRIPREAIDPLLADRTLSDEALPLLEKFFAVDPALYDNSLEPHRFVIEQLVKMKTLGARAALERFAQGEFELGRHATGGLYKENRERILTIAQKALAENP